MPNGHTDFGALQDVLGQADRRIGYYVFDLLELDGEDLTRQPLVERKRKLAALLKDQPPSGPLFYSDHVVGNGADVFENACRMKLEGIISKRADAPYRSARSKDWLKVKCEHGPGVHHHRLAAVGREGAAVLLAPAWPCATASGWPMRAASAAASASANWGAVAASSRHAR